MADKDIYIAIGNRIREIRTVKNMTQSDLSAAANISLPSISDIELGKTNMHIDTFVRLKDALGVSADDLLKKCNTENDAPAKKEIERLIAAVPNERYSDLIKLLNDIATILN